MSNLKPLIFKQNFTWRLLFYSWKDLKRRFFHSKNLNGYDSFKIDSISSYWFVKTAEQIRKGSFVYKEHINNVNISQYTTHKFLVNRLKQRIIENAFVILLEPYFYLDFSFVNLNIKKVFVYNVKIFYKIFLTV
jgi:hypothetical protein